MDPTDWAIVVREQAPLIWRTVNRLLNDRADAADCFQETLVCAWDLAGRQRVRNWPGLLQRLATARALDHLRLRHRRAQYMTPCVDLSQVRSSAAGPLARVQSTECADQLRRALADLPKKLSQTYCLRHLNEMSYEQIAEELGITVAAVGTNLHRASGRLRAAMKALEIDQPGGKP